VRNAIDKIKHVQPQVVLYHGIFSNGTIAYPKSHFLRQMDYVKPKELIELERDISTLFNKIERLTKKNEFINELINNLEVNYKFHVEVLDLLADFVKYIGLASYIDNAIMEIARRQNVFLTHVKNTRELIDRFVNSGGRKLLKYFSKLSAKKKIEDNAITRAITLLNNVIGEPNAVKKSEVFFSQVPRFLGDALLGYAFGEILVKVFERK